MLGLTVNHHTVKAAKPLLDDRRSKPCLQQRLSRRRQRGAVIAVPVVTPLAGIVGAYRMAAVIKIVNVSDVTP